MAILVGCRRSAASTLLEIQQGRFWMDYGKAFRDFPSHKAFVPGWVDVMGYLAPQPEDPRNPRGSKLQPSPHVVVARCPSWHPLRDELRCLARRPLEPELRICYAGQVHESKDHQKYSEKYSLESGGFVIDAAHFCNEMAFVNHFYGIAKEPNCRIAQPDVGFAEICVTQAIGEGEELLVDYGMEHCLRNQVPHPDVPPWARDFAALAELNQVQEELRQLQNEVADDRQLRAFQMRLQRVGERRELLSEEGRSQVLQLQESLLQELHEMSRKRKDVLTMENLHRK